MATVARYDLSWVYHPPTFDFFTWLSIVKAMGATEIVIDTSNPRPAKFSDEEIKQRIRNIILAGVPMGDLPWREGQDGDTLVKPLLPNFYPYMHDFRPLKSTLPPADHKYTVTIRRMTKNAFRNSGQVVWRGFADKIGALVIEDYSVKPIPLMERMAIYAGARMNFGIPNGPLSTLMFTHYPYMICDCGINPKGWGQHGIAVPGGQVPWARKDQMLVWDTCTVDTLMERFKRHVDQ